jgi:hypothetical protein
MSKQQTKANPRPIRPITLRELLRTDPEEVEKLTSQMYPVLKAVANTMERQTRPHFPPHGRKETDTRLPRHLDRAIVAAETYPQRDLLFRRLSSYCYNLSKWFINKQDYQQAHKWMTLSQSYLNLSIHPKELQADEKLETQLEQLEKDIKEQKQRDLEKARQNQP